jgi:2-polyprenyl-3-methyl-5-hydroxy-6-metoxy-1,4-benzoquinol methylase
VAAHTSTRLTAAEPAEHTPVSDGSREFPCDLCGATEAVEVPYCREFTAGELVHICCRCGFVYVKRRRSADRIAQTWTEEIFGAGYTAAIPAVTGRLVYVAELLHDQLDLRGKVVCEIGAGEGHLLDIIRQPRYGAEVFGIEPSPANARRLADAGIAHFNGTIEQFATSGQAPTGGVDIVAILWTLENCQDCRAMLGAAHFMLKPGGTVVVATGSRILVPFKKPLHLYFSRNPADTHAFRFSANTLQGILAVSGFEPVHVNRYLDHDVLCVIARKAPEGATIAWHGDDYLAVHNFFERWYVDTTIYFPEAPRP